MAFSEAFALIPFRASGSCWALGILYSGIGGSTLPRAAAAHAKDRLRTSYLDMTTLEALTNVPTNKVWSPLSFVGAVSNW